MSVKVRIPGALRTLTGGEGNVECHPGTVDDILSQLEGRFAGIKGRLMEGGELRRFVNVYVAGEDIRFMEGLDTPVSDGQELAIIPAVAGG